MIYSVAQNGAVGWVQSQLYQAANAPYWGGWVGTNGAITTTGSGAGYISSIVNGNDGTITFRVTTGNNGTNTTGTISAGTFVVSDATVTVKSTIPFYNFTVQNGSGTFDSMIVIFGEK